MLPAGLFARYPLSRQTIVVLHDVAAVTLALPLALMLRENRLLDTERAAYILSCLPLLVGSSLTAILLLGSYRAVWRYMGVGEITRLAQFALLATLLFWTGQFLVDRLDHLPRSGPAIQFLVAMFLLIGARIAYGSWCRWQDRPTAPQSHRQPLLLIGAGDGTALFIQMLAHRRHADYEILGIVCDDLSRNRSINGVPVLGRTAEIDTILANLQVQGMTPARLVVTRPHHELGREAVTHVMQSAYAARIPVEQLPDLMRFRSETHAQHAPPAVPVSVYPTLKRLFDITVSATALILTAPLLAIAAIAVAALIQRPVLFVQIRPGLHRQPFRLLKLRTMLDPMGPDGRLRPDAARTPALGRLLRRTRLDELPQLINVLKGDMAIIGPRPLMASDLDAMLQAMPDEARTRATTRPGLTGWAQVNGGHQLRPDEKLALDLWYTENATLKLDTQILLRTIAMMLLGEKRDEQAIEKARGITPQLVGAAE